ncbi:hypothetical protein M569_04509, partial [Genlisea aurea]
RSVCSAGCGRPTAACLCRILPETPFSTRTKVVILQHPHERRHKLATVPVLSKCLRNCEIVSGRKLKLGDSKILDSHHDQAREGRRGRVFYLFPGPNAVPIREAFAAPCDETVKDEGVLIVFDGTWNHAKEMVAASFPFLSRFATQVCFNFDYTLDGGSIFDSELILRKEPFAGCMSTMEAVGRSLGVVEPNGMDIELKIIEVLRGMVSFQACFLK